MNSTILNKQKRTVKDAMSKMKKATTEWKDMDIYTHSHMN